MQHAEKKPEILCLRPETDFTNFGVTPPSNLTIHYKNPLLDGDEINRLKINCEVLVIPAVGEKINPSFFSGTNIKMVQVTGAGFDRLEIDKLREKNIVVCNMPGGSAESVAEYCHAGAITMLRQLLTLSTSGVSNYTKIRSMMISKKMRSLTGLSVGIIGYGNIGKTTAELFSQSGCEILVFDPIKSNVDTINGNTVKNVLLTELLKTSDIISIHTPLTEDTRNMIDVNELSIMKPTSILINAARGGIVNEKALANAVIYDQIGGAVIDVFSTEPPLTDNPLFKVPSLIRSRLLLTPHIAGITSQAWNDLFSRSWKNILDFVSDKSVNFIVD